MGTVWEICKEVECRPVEILGREFCERLWGDVFEYLHSQEFSPLSFLKVSTLFLDKNEMWIELAERLSEVLGAEGVEKAVEIGSAEWYWAVGVKLTLFAVYPHKVMLGGKE